MNTMLEMTIIEIGLIVVFFIAYGWASFKKGQESMVPFIREIQSATKKELIDHLVKFNVVEILASSENERFDSLTIGPSLKGYGLTEPDIEIIRNLPAPEKADILDYVRFKHNSEQANQ